MVYLRYYCSVSKYWSISDKKIGLVDDRSRITAEQPEIKITDESKSSLSENHPKTPIVI